MPRVCLPIVAAVVALIFVVLSSGASGEELLVNGGFEAGDTQPWQVTGGELQISDVAHSGYGAQLTSNGEQDAMIYQRVAVQSSRMYELSGWVLLNDPAVGQVTLRITWFDADDISLRSSDSPLSADDPTYRLLTTGS